MKNIGGWIQNADQWHSNASTPAGPKGAQKKGSTIIWPFTKQNLSSFWADPGFFLKPTLPAPRVGALPGISILALAFWLVWHPPPKTYTLTPTHTPGPSPQGTGLVSLKKKPGKTHNCNDCRTMQWSENTASVYMMCKQPLLVITLGKTSSLLGIDFETRNQIMIFYCGGLRVLAGLMADPHATKSSLGKIVSIEQKYFTQKKWQVKKTWSSDLLHTFFCLLGCCSKHSYSSLQNKCLINRIECISN